MATGILVGCGTTAGGDAQPDESGAETPVPVPTGAPAAGDGDEKTVDASPGDTDPDGDLDPSAPSPPDDPAMPPATQAELIGRFAPHLHLHPQDANRPANVDWFLARASMRYDHAGCLDHEILALGKVTQTSLIAASHPDTKLLCQHDPSAVRASTASDRFFLRVEDSATYAGAPRALWKTYVVWRPTTGGLVDVEYWAFYAFNDGFSLFDHEADWEYVRVRIDPKADGGQGAAVEYRYSEHKGGTVLAAGDPKIVLDGSHVVSYVAKGTHANYPRPGTYDIPGTYIATDEAKEAAPADVWKTETSTVLVGTRAAPKNGQTFVKYWGRWGTTGSLPETSGITRHFP